MKPYPEYICHDCGTKYCRGLQPGTVHMATYHIDTCQCCGAKNVPCTEPRDYLHFIKWPVEGLPKQQSPEEALIDAVMDSFDFEKAHEMMTAVNWCWSHTPQEGGMLKVPCVERIRRSARSLLERLVKSPSDCVIATGGLRAEKYNDDDKTGSYSGLSLKFVFCETDVFFDEL